MKNKKILITGAAGGIGSTLSHELFKNKFNLILVDNLRNGYIENLYIDINGNTLPNFYKIDINSDDFINLIKTEKPDVIIHLAAVTSLPDCEVNIKDCFDINVKGTASVLSAASKFGVKRVIFGSTSAVYESTEMGIEGYNENDFINPHLFYSLSKKMSEEICFSFIENYNLDVVILRFSNVFGPKQDLNRKSPPVINYIIREFYENRSPILHSNGKQKRDYIHVDDVVKSINQLIQKDVITSKILNICSSTLISLDDIVSAIKKTFNNPDLTETYRDADKLWDSYTELFDGEYPLKKDVVKKETNKTCLVNNTSLIKELEFFPNKDILPLIEDVTKQIIIHLDKKTKK
jgi:nucleoside-diphosphate-sugar epimerase